MSPVEIWGMPYFWQMKAACVPLPAPGAPNKISFMEVLEESRNSCLPDRPTGADSPCVIFLSRARIARTGLTLAYTQRAKLSPVQSPKTAFCCPTKPHVQLCCEWRCRASPLAHLYWRMRDRIQADNRARTRSRSSAMPGIAVGASVLAYAGSDSGGQPGAHPLQIFGGVHAGAWCMGRQVDGDAVAVPQRTQLFQRLQHLGRGGR